MKPILTIAICTYNREAYIGECLDSLQNQTADPELFEILVVNNLSTDGTAELVSNYRSKPHLRVVDEANQGLSHARNAALENCRTEWLLYLDDDALAKSNLVEVAVSLAHQNKYEIFGGMYIPWYKHGKPYWLKDAYVQSPLVGRQAGELGKGEYLSGGIFAIKRNLLKGFNGFNTTLGMKGGVAAYGEETELQNRLRNKGHRIYFTPDLVIEHLVAPYKLDIQWFFRSAYARGKDIPGMKHWAYSPFRVARLSAEALAMVLLKLPVNCLRMLKKNYYMENLLIDTFARVVKRAGMIAKLMELKKR